MAVSAPQVNHIDARSSFLESIGLPRARARKVIWKQCKEEGCERRERYLSRGRCRACRHRLEYRRKNPQAKRIRPRHSMWTIEELLEQTVPKSIVPEQGQCLEWQGRKSTTGYGRVIHGGKQVDVHRLIFELLNGAQPKTPGRNAIPIRRHCNNKVCINPDHLFLATPEAMASKRKPCKVVGCTEPSASNGMCRRHEGRWRYERDNPGARRNRSRKAEWTLESLLKETDQVGDCMFWVHGKERGGYGKTNHAGKSWLTHRLAYTLAHGEIPDGLHCCHRCDQPSCLNPDHLFLGTNQDNAADRDAKGRQAKGSRHGLSVFTEEEVKDILSSHRDMGTSGAELARLYGVTPTTIYGILNRKAWEHVKLEDAE